MPARTAFPPRTLRLSVSVSPRGLRSQRLTAPLSYSPLFSSTGMQIYWIDNARFWLETFVIAKHLMVYLGTLYRWDTWWQARAQPSPARPCRRSPPSAPSPPCPLSPRSPFTL